MMSYSHRLKLPSGGIGIQNRLDEKSDGARSLHWLSGEEDWFASLKLNASKTKRKSVRKRLNIKAKILIVNR
jgi:hypothetical protein